MGGRLSEAQRLRRPKHSIHDGRNAAFRTAALHKPHGSPRSVRVGVLVGVDVASPATMTLLAFCRSMLVVQQCFVFSLNRSCYPTTSVHPECVLILHLGDTN